MFYSIVSLSRVSNAYKVDKKGYIYIYTYKIKRKIFKNREDYKQTNVGFLSIFYLQHSFSIRIN